MSVLENVSLNCSTATKNPHSNSHPKKFFYIKPIRLLSIRNYFARLMLAMRYSPPLQHFCSFAPYSHITSVLPRVNASVLKNSSLSKSYRIIQRCTYFIQPRVKCGLSAHQPSFAPSAVYQQHLP